MAHPLCLWRLDVWINDAVIFQVVTVSSRSYNNSPLHSLRYITLVQITAKTIAYLLIVNLLVL